MMDPPRQVALRRLVSAGFTPRRIASLEATIRSFVRSRIELMQDKARDGQAVDVHRDFSSPIPTFVLAHLLGVPESDRPRFDPWVHALTSLQDDMALRIEIARRMV